MLAPALGGRSVHRRIERPSRDKVKALLPRREKTTTMFCGGVEIRDFFREAPEFERNPAIGGEAAKRASAAGGGGIFAAGRSPGMGIFREFGANRADPLHGARQVAGGVAGSENATFCGAQKH
ncbi:hypothetical protein H1W37_04180 [Stappia taiwanensis]|uniref:Uncharacterized protein n=1 Tax=Stappia taiwanensis TaxID=992267 RepID=A0A838XJX2_9HYPH|nr:hypothetical protein [Stappia taiwanensis]MBA4610835.1 hypothetical protein [Stappia taiwanensis]